MYGKSAETLFTAASHCILWKNHDRKLWILVCVLQRERTDILVTKGAIQDIIHAIQRRPATCWRTLNSISTSTYVLILYILQWLYITFLICRQSDIESLEYEPSNTIPVIQTSWTRFFNCIALCVPEDEVRLSQWMQRNHNHFELLQRVPILFNCCTCLLKSWNSHSLSWKKLLYYLSLKKAEAVSTALYLYVMLLSISLVP